MNVLSVAIDEGSQMARPITSLEGFVRKLRKLSEDRKHEALFFRGHAKRSYELKPSIYRSKNITRAEHLMIRQLMAEQPFEFERDLSNFDRLVRAQHYGLPTRLLDVSSNPLVALYFASDSNFGSDGQVVVLTPEIQKQKYFDSDSVSCMSALSFMKYEEKDAIRGCIRLIWEKIGRAKVDDWMKPLSNDFLDEFNENEVIQKLIQMVRIEKPDFRPILQPVDLVKIISVVPRRTHARIAAQNGGFLIFGLGSTPNDLNMPDVTVERFNIKGSEKEKILRELAVVGISEQTLFPEIEKSAMNIRKRYS